MEYAHQQGVVHCDLKPSNLLLDAHDRVVITDFGFAHGLREAQDAAAGSIGGTMGYLAPEIMQGSAPTPACDVYSLGCVLAEALDSQSAPHDPLLEHLSKVAVQCRAVDPAARPQRLSVLLRPFIEPASRTQ
jgi:serine/threonine protein kinase